MSSYIVSLTTKNAFNTGIRSDNMGNRERKKKFENSNETFELFRFYTQGFVQWFLIFVAATVGTLTPFSVLTVTFSYLHFWTRSMLYVVYFAFAVASGYSAARLHGIWRLIKNTMNESMYSRHSTLVYNYDPLALGTKKWLLSNEDKHWKSIVCQCLIASAVFIVYFLLWLTFVLNI
jgi:hypothetical protein